MPKKLRCTAKYLVLFISVMRSERWQHSFVGKVREGDKYDLRIALSEFCPGLHESSTKRYALTRHSPPDHPPILPGWPIDTDCIYFAFIFPCLGPLVEPQPAKPSSLQPGDLANQPHRFANRQTRLPRPPPHHHHRHSAPLYPDPSVISHSLRCPPR
jgi:hypothetical protein